MYVGVCVWRALLCRGGWKVEGAMILRLTVFLRNVYGHFTVCHKRTAEQIEALLSLLPRIAIAIAGCMCECVCTH
uniref:Putative secreted protein n=1 Tax=Anopheles darlingi TaxID=43151 RepID=A0A2M4D5X3_ANODA